MDTEELLDNIDYEELFEGTELEDAIDTASGKPSSADVGGAIGALVGRRIGEMLATRIEEAIRESLRKNESAAEGEDEEAAEGEEAGGDGDAGDEQSELAGRITESVEEAIPEGAEGDEDVTDRIATAVEDAMTSEDSDGDGTGEEAAEGEGPEGSESDEGGEEGTEAEEATEDTEEEPEEEASEDESEADIEEADSDEGTAEAEEESEEEAAEGADEEEVPQPQSAEDLQDMSYRELQRLAKKHDVKANLSQEELIDELEDELSVEA